jgi:hypothetical protein
MPNRHQNRHQILGRRRVADGGGGGREVATEPHGIQLVVDGSGPQVCRTSAAMPIFESLRQADGSGNRPLDATSRDAPSPRSSKLSTGVGRRVGAPLALKAADSFQSGKRWKLRLHKRGGNEHAAPAHHTFEECVDAHHIRGQTEGPHCRSATRGT